MKIKNRIIILILTLALICGSVCMVSAGKSSVPYKNIVKKHMQSHGYKRLDRIKVVDKTKNNSWVVYYVECDGDDYVVTVWHKKVDVCEILN